MDVRQCQGIGTAFVAKLGNQNGMKYERQRLTNTGWENCLWKGVQWIRDFGEEWESGYLKGLEKAKE